MAIDWHPSALVTQTETLNAQADRLVNRSRTGTSGASTPSRENATMIKAGKDFESILLGNWLQQAEQSFATVPGGDGQDDDGSKEQFQGIAMQALAGSLTASGGIGIARMITESLQSRQHTSKTTAAPPSQRPAPTDSHTDTLPAPH